MAKFDVREWPAGGVGHMEIVQCDNCKRLLNKSETKHVVSTTFGIHAEFDVCPECAKLFRRKRK